MNISTLIQKIQKNGYKSEHEKVPDKLPDSHIEDENQTVVWNREFVKSHNEKRAAIIQENHRRDNECHNRLKEDLLNALVEEYDINKDQANVAFNYAYEERHSSGYGDVIYAAQEVCELYKSMDALKDQKTT